jgi:hypothetical protein
MVTLLGGNRNTDPFGEHFAATSLSPDGRFVLGFQEVQGGEAGIASAPVLLGDVNAQWRVEVESAPSSIFPRFSPTSFLVAMNNWATGELHIGMIHVLAP